MAILKLKTLILTLFLLSTVTTFAVQSEPDIHEILVSYGLPPGLLPADPAYVSFNKENGKFTVGLTAKFCTLDFGRGGTSFMGYGKRISGSISQGNIQQVHGIYMLFSSGWLPVFAIRMRDDGIAVEFQDEDRGFWTPVSVGIFAEVYPCIPWGGVPLGKGGGGANDHGITASGLAEV